jgi:hypothetical protein
MQRHSVSDSHENLSKSSPTILELGSKLPTPYRKLRRHLLIEIKSVVEVDLPVLLEKQKQQQ